MSVLLGILVQGPDTAQVWSLVLGGIIGSLVTTSVGAIMLSNKLAALQATMQAEINGLRRDVDRLTSRMMNGKE